MPSTKRLDAGQLEFESHPISVHAEEPDRKVGFVPVRWAGRDLPRDLGIVFVEATTPDGDIYYYTVVDPGTGSPESCMFGTRSEVVERVADAIRSRLEKT